MSDWKFLRKICQKETKEEFEDKKKQSEIIEARSNKIFMNKHILWMIIGCGLPLLLIFFAPALGLGSGVTLLIFIIAMFACHLLMPMHQHGGHNHEHDQQNSQPTNTENHEQHH